MRQTDFINALRNWVIEYRRDVLPLREDTDDYDDFNEAYKTALEDLHALVEGYVDDEGLIEHRREASGQD